MLTVNQNVVSDFVNPLPLASIVRAHATGSVGSRPLPICAHERPHVYNVVSVTRPRLGKLQFTRSNWARSARD